jgi:hypothetical protein
MDKKPSAWIAGGLVLSAAWAAAKIWPPEMPPPKSGLPSAARPAATAPASGASAVSVVPGSALTKRLGETCRREKDNAKLCFDVLRSEILAQSRQIWGAVWQHEALMEANPQKDPHVLTLTRAKHENWEITCAAQNGGEDIPRGGDADAYFRMAIQCLSTAQEAARNYNIAYNAEYTSFLSLEVSIVSRWELPRLR